MLLEDKFYFLEIQKSLGSDHGHLHELMKEYLDLQFPSKNKKLSENEKIFEDNKLH